MHRDIKSLNIFLAKGLVAKVKGPDLIVSI